MSNLGNKEIMAQNIQRLMEQKGVERKDVCNALGFKYTTFVDWVNGKTYPRIDKIEKMANYFGVPKSELVEEYKNCDQTYYINDETAEVAQEIFDNKELRALFDVQRNMSADDLKALHNMALALKRKERRDDDF